ncbi:hypothetical protein KCP74_25175 [Salmonella enterica subsp. enterica]|nr:hypothetical protein KCP74_25175 [Salmonella enterica subsp. enterica]
MYRDYAAIPCGCIEGDGRDFINQRRCESVAKEATFRALNDTGDIPVIKRKERNRS